MPGKQSQFNLSQPSKWPAWAYKNVLDHYKKSKEGSKNVVAERFSALVGGFNKTELAEYRRTLVNDIFVDALKDGTAVMGQKVEVAVAATPPAAKGDVKQQEELKQAEDAIRKEMAPGAFDKMPPASRTLLTKLRTILRQEQEELKEGKAARTGKLTAEQEENTARWRKVIAESKRLEAAGLKGKQGLKGLAAAAEGEDTPGLELLVASAEPSGDATDQRTPHDDGGGGASQGAKAQKKGNLQGDISMNNKISSKLYPATDIQYYAYKNRVAKFNRRKVYFPYQHIPMTWKRNFFTNRYAHY